MTGISEYKKILDVALIAVDLQEISPPLAPGALRSIANSTSADIQAGHHTPLVVAFFLLPTRGPTPELSVSRKMRLNASVFIATQKATPSINAPNQ
jgi:hypothetical protein